MTTSAGLRTAYREAGVDVDAGDRVVALLRERVGDARRTGIDVISGIGAFASAVAVPDGYREPVVVSATDGVGTKTQIAAALRRYDTIGRDLVAMCADDVACLGATPLLFLDYIAVGRLEPEMVATIVSGIGEGCEVAGCALVGGETAEHPGLIAEGQFDLAGFCIGICERDALIEGQRARPGDALIGLASSGLHANGYSLVRAVLDRDGLSLSAPYLDAVRGVLGEGEVERVRAEEAGRAECTLGDVLLEPTRIYAADLAALRSALGDGGHGLRGLAHITGGGLPGNVPRAMPDSLAARIDPRSWPVASVFRLIAALAGLDGPQLRATFNAGIGMVAIVDRDSVETALDLLGERGVRAYRIGDVVMREETNGAGYIEAGT